MEDISDLLKTFFQLHHTWYRGHQAAMKGIKDGTRSASDADGATAARAGLAELEQILKLLRS
jgi:hypothetical protein